MKDVQSPETGGQGSSGLKIRPYIKVHFSGEKRFFGPGPYRLLVLIDEVGSLRKACEEMGMSYSKGWKIVKYAEEQVGFPIVEKRRGGAEGGSSQLTENGRRLLQAYAAFNEEVQQLAEVAFRKYAADLNG